MKMYKSNEFIVKLYYIIMYIDKNKFRHLMINYTSCVLVCQLVRIVTIVSMEHC